MIPSRWKRYDPGMVMISTIILYKTEALSNFLWIRPWMTWQFAIIFLAYLSAHTLSFEFKITFYTLGQILVKEKKPNFPVPQASYPQDKNSAKQIFPSSSSNIQYLFQALIFLMKLYYLESIRTNSSNLGCNMHNSIFLKCNDV